MQEPRTDLTVELLAEKLAFASKDIRGRRNNMLIIGAGASISAGIPGAPEIAKRLVRVIASRLDLPMSDGDDARAIYLRLLTEGKFADCSRRDIKSTQEEDEIDWWLVYDHSFRRYFTQPDDVREVFSSILDEAGGAINWSHLVIGELVHRGYFNTVITTNFDQLALSGLVRAGVIPVVCDGLESLNRIDGAPHHPQLIEIHGSRHTYLLRNDPLDVAAVQKDPSAIAAIQNLLQHAHSLVVVGYGGREEGIMNLLIKAAAVYPDKNLFWVLHSENYSDMSERAIQLLSNSRNSGVILGQDSDRFFLELAKYLRVGSPSVVGNPLSLVDAWLGQLNRSRITDDDIAAEVNEASRLVKKLIAFDVDGDIDPEKLLEKTIRAKRLSGDLEGAYKIYLADMDSTLSGGSINNSRSKILEEGIIVCADYSAKYSSEEAFIIGIDTLDALTKDRSASIDRNRLAAVSTLLATAGVNSGAGTKDLRRSLALQRRLLKSITKSDNADGWGRLQHGIGNALVGLTNATSSDKYAVQAIEAFRLAQIVQDRQKEPERWAACQNGIGNAHAALARIRKHSSCLQDALDAYLDAVKALSIESFPALYSLIQLNISGVYRDLYAATGLDHFKSNAISAAESSLNAAQRADSEPYSARAAGRLAGYKQLFGPVSPAEPLITDGDQKDPSVIK